MTAAGPDATAQQQRPAASLPARRAHIALNLIFLVPGETGGMEVYARELIPALRAAAPAGTRFTAFINREASRVEGPWRELRCVTVPVHARSRLQWVLGEQALLPGLARRAGVDLLHSLASTAPARGRFRRVVTVHDLIFARFPEAHSGLRERGMRTLVPLAARRSDRVIADSHNTLEDLVQLLEVPRERIDVVPLGVPAPHAGRAADPVRTRARFDLGERRVLLSLSAKRPHKNLPALLGALARIPRERRPLLVLPGYETWHERELRERAHGAQLDVRFLGWVPDAELEDLWEVAAAFVFPSLYEGFGLPVLEAMARGVPVASSNAASLPEIAGDAALLFDPRDERAIAQAIERLLSDEQLRRELAAKGRERARAFTWERTARATLASYARALRSPAPSTASRAGPPPRSSPP